MSLVPPPFHAEIPYDVKQWLNEVYKELSSNRVIQIQSAYDGTVATGTTTLPHDNTVPQNTEGDEYLTKAIKPTNASNLLRIDVAAVLASSAAQYMAVALFQDSNANALGNTYEYMNGAGYTKTIPLTHFMTAGTTDSITFKVRCGGNVAGTTTFNGSGGAQKYGGALDSHIIITEYQRDL